MTKLNKYQRYYDIIHSDKDYGKETILLEKAIKEYSPFPVKKILSLGCGTAGHEVLLAKKGYAITGLDHSKEMLRIAFLKAKSNNVIVELKLADIRNFHTRRKYDTVVSMYNVLCDLRGLEDLDKTFASAAKSVKKNGLFIFDCLYGPAILKHRPENRTKKIVFDGKKIIQTRSSALDITHSRIVTLFEVFEAVGSRKIKIAQKKHAVYFWYFPELQYLLLKNRFKVVKTGNAMDLKKDISEDSWDMFVVAKKL